MWSGAAPHVQPTLQAPPSHWSVSGRLLNLSREAHIPTSAGALSRSLVFPLHLGMESGLQRIFQTLGSWVAGGPHASQLAAAAPDREGESPLLGTWVTSVDHF